MYVSHVKLELVSKLGDFRAVSYVLFESRRSEGVVFREREVSCICGKRRKRKPKNLFITLGASLFPRDPEIKLDEVVSASKEALSSRSARIGVENRRVVCRETLESSETAFIFSCSLSQLFSSIGAPATSSGKLGHARPLRCFSRYDLSTEIFMTQPPIKSSRYAVHVLWPGEYAGNSFASCRSSRQYSCLPPSTMSAQSTGHRRFLPFMLTIDRLSLPSDCANW